MRAVLLSFFISLFLAEAKSQIIADSTYNPLIKKESKLRNSLVGTSIFDYTDDHADLTKILSKNQKTHINLWSITCKPCIQEFPELNELKEAFENDNVQFVAIAKEEQVKTDRILAINQLDFDQYFDGAALFVRLGVKQYPVNLFIDEHGIIREVSMGVFMKGEIKDGRTVMKMNNLPYYKMILSQWTNRS